MAQGGSKIKSSKPNPKKSNRPTQKTQKKKKQKQVSKGWKTFAAKGRKASQAKQEISTSKAINRKNEIAVAARAVGSGAKFALKDLKEAGKKEVLKNKDALRKREAKSKMSERMKEQLNKLK